MTTTTVNEGDKVNITVNKGKTYDHVFTYTDPDTGAVIDITGYSARMQIRETIDAADYVYQALSGGDISLGGVTGQVALSIPAAITAAWTFVSGVYDLELVSPAGKVIGLVGVSTVKTKPEVTR
ncbi:MAG TPA: hypothetical protein VJ325_05695 [Thiobacillus sp.]|nr:hypothetical protein [Thiobacillus sp.]